MKIFIIIIALASTAYAEENIFCKPYPINIKPYIEISAQPKGSKPTLITMVQFKDFDVRDGTLMFCNLVAKQWTIIKKDNEPFAYNTVTGQQSGSDYFGDNTYEGELDWIGDQIKKQIVNYYSMRVNETPAKPTLSMNSKDMMMCAYNTIQNKPIIRVYANTFDVVVGKNGDLLKDNRGNLVKQKQTIVPVTFEFQNHNIRNDALIVCNAVANEWTMEYRFAEDIRNEDINEPGPTTEEIDNKKLYRTNETDGDKFLYASAKNTKLEPFATHIKTKRSPARSRGGNTHKGELTWIIKNEITSAINQMLLNKYSIQ